MEWMEWDVVDQGIRGSEHQGIGVSVIQYDIR